MVPPENNFDSQKKPPDWQGVDVYGIAIKGSLLFHGCFFDEDLVFVITAKILVFV
jgi:hypothetical protein